MFRDLPRKVRRFYELVLTDHHQPVPIRTVADVARTPVSYEQRVINENWTFDHKPRDPETGNEIAPNNLFVFKYLILERRLSAYRGMDLWQFIPHLVNNREHTRILSIGSGPCAVEMEIAAQFKRPYIIDCMDLNESLIAWATSQAQARGLNLRPMVSDLNTTTFTEKYDVVMVVAALHHFIELESVCAKINEALADDGLFVTYEPVMRSGMYLWPATRFVLGLLFLLMPARLRVNHQDYPGETRVDPVYHEIDRSGWTFESIRSGDIPDVLRTSFKTVHYGRGMTFLRRVSDTLYGPNYDMSTRRDQRITDALCWLDRFFRATRLLRPEGLFFIGRPRRARG
jgi:2-polyprenyl-3-methyl-5-hydroxy-6-metoxy-1,4-benzoquinol methylase